MVELKLTDSKVAKQYGKKKGSIILVPENQVDKLVNNGWAKPIPEKIADKKADE